MTDNRLARLSGIEAINALLDPAHVVLAGRLQQRCREHLASRPEPASDEEARREAKVLLALMARENLLAVLVDQDVRALCLTREALAAASPLADAVFAIQALVATSLRQAAGRSPQSGWFQDVVTGRVMAAFAMSEPGAGSDAAALRTTARRTADGWVLDGEKHLISNAGIADLYLVFAVTTPGAGSRGIGAFAVPADTPGFTFAGAQVMSAPHPLGKLTFEGCCVPPDACVTPPDEGFKIGMATLDRLRPSVGAAACGMASRALAAGIEHAAVRHQFGVPLASQPLIREKVGRLATDLEAARLLVYRAAWQADHHPGRITLEASMAKSFATEAAQRIVDEAVQIVGGLGVVIGHPVERMYRAVRALRIYEGTTEIQRLIVADQLMGNHT